MGSVKIKRYDRNRFRKVYPRFRVLPDESYKADGPLSIESREISFNDEDTLTFQLAEDYNTAPTVTVTPFSEGTNQTSDIVVYVETVTVSGVPPGGRKATVVLKASAKYTGKVFVQSIKAG